MGEEAKSPEDFTLDLEDFYGNELSVHFEDIQGRPWSFVSDMGDERTGIVEGRLVQLLGVRIQKDFQFGIKGVTINVGEGRFINSAGTLKGFSHGGNDTLKSITFLLEARMA
jgi:hypothetical protein